MLDGASALDIAGQSTGRFSIDGGEVSLPVIGVTLNILATEER